LGELAEQESLALSYQANITYVYTRPEEFDLTNEQQDNLTKLDDRLRGIRQDIYDKAEKCYEIASECQDRSRADLLSIHRDVPERKPAPVIPGACHIPPSEEPPHQFITFGGGCKDVSTGIIWSSPSATTYDLHKATDYCAKLREGGVGNWRLPAAAELQNVANGVKAQKYLASNPSGWFWSVEGSRVNLRLGTTSELDPSLALNVLCRR
jgi:hypothetical protein